jgi:hypothetical protein
MRVRLHAGTIASDVKEVDAVNYVIFFSEDDTPLVIVTEILGNVCVVTCKDSNFNSILDKSGYSKRKV